MPDGWIADEMADILHSYYLTVEPDQAIDVLVYGANSERGMDFDEFKASGDYLYAKILEAQSADGATIKITIDRSSRDGLTIQDYPNSQ